MLFRSVERLYFVRGETRIALPTAESSMSFVSYISGTSVMENGYEIYKNGVMNFKGNHSADNFDVSSNQVFKIKVEDELLDWSHSISFDENTQTSTITIVEDWSVSGKKEIKFSQKANFSFNVSDAQRVYGTSLELISGPTKTSNNPEYTKSGDNFVRTVTSNYTNRYNLCSVVSTTTHTEAYLIYREKQIDYQLPNPSVVYDATSNTSNTTIDEGIARYNRKVYEVSFTHSLIGNKKSIVNVDEEIANDPTTPDAWGEIDWEKTQQFGGVSWTW